MRTIAIILWAQLWLPLLLHAAPPFVLESQRRDFVSGEVVRRPELIDPAKTVVVVIDMWDRHWCKTYTERVANLVPRMNETVAAARRLGIQVVWAPSDVANFYADYPQRKKMKALPAHQEPATVALQPAPPPEGLDCCECGPSRPCRSHAAWTRQQAGLTIAEGDLIGDCNEARELYNLCAERGIDTVIYMGVASNMCVCHRAFGMLNARRHGLRVFFVRDLVEAITANGIHPATRQADPNFTPAKGTARTEHYLEQHVAASVASRQLIATAGQGAFAQDPRPRIVFVIADDEYKTDQTLPEFARRHLAADFQLVYCLARGNEPKKRNDLPGLEALYDADLVVLSVRRRALPVAQMDFLERYLRSGQPLVALRVSVVPFQVEGKDCPEGHVIWRDFDQEVLGCHYQGYPAESRETGCDVWTVASAKGHPILKGLETARLHSRSWLYRQRPLAGSTTVLWQGRWSDREPEEPVAWTQVHEGGRVFYTTLGCEADFQEEAFNRILRNAIHWALGRE